MNRLALALLTLAATLGGCSANTDTMPQTVANPKPEAAAGPSFHTLILGKWRAVGPSLEQVWEFKENGVVNLTSTMSGTMKANKVIPQDERITFGALSQSGKYTFVDESLAHVSLEEGKSGGLSTAVQDSDWKLESVTSTEMVVKFKGQKTGYTFKRVE